MILTHTISQNDRRGFLQSDLVITVDFDCWKNEVKCVCRVRTYSHEHRIYTDISVIMFNEFHDQLEQMVKSINWEGLALKSVRRKNLML